MANSRGDEEDIVEGLRPDGRDVMTGTINDSGIPEGDAFDNESKDGREEGPWVGGVAEWEYLSYGRVECCTYFVC